jgi:prepilin-type N-terminal cleavage/methylation domain-containing protein
VRRRGERGLSLIEALAAIAILGIAMSSLMAWRSALLRQHARISEAEAIATARTNALSLLSDVNPMATPEGTLDVSPGVRVSWTATPLTPSHRSVAYPAGEGAFRVALYRVDALVERPPMAPLAFSLERLGWASLDGPTGEP